MYKDAPKIKIMDFQSSLKDPAIPIAIDFDSKKNVLLLAFGGMIDQIGFPMFEFDKITRGMEKANKIYLRDEHRLWYHHGLPNLGENIDEIAVFLRQYTTHPSTQRIVVFGNSGGGYAALLFGHILKVDEVHAFGPRTFINPIKRLLHFDRVVRKRLFSMFRLFFRGQRKLFDLKKVFLSSPESKVNYHVYYPTNHRIDKIHATRMKSIPGFHLHPYQHNKHNLIRMLKQSGELKEIIEQSILFDDLVH